MQKVSSRTKKVNTELYLTFKKIKFEWTRLIDLFVHKIVEYVRKDFILQLQTLFLVEMYKSDIKSNFIVKL